MASTEPPTGTVTFLFTDIEGSTRMTQELGDAWPPLLERHRRIARAAWTQHGGVEISTEGDSFFVVFVSANAAVTAAVQTQRDLAAESWPAGVEIRVRMGLHTGEGQLGGGSYVGLDVHRAARIAAAGHGGQVLLSATTMALVEGSLPEGVGARDLGAHGLKDLSRPERIWQLTVDGLPGDFPPLKALTPVAAGLPSQLTSFLGREREIAEILLLLSETRLLTLVGPGGTGKTRLALQVAAGAADRYADGVCFVGLSMVRDTALVLPAIAQAVGLVQPGGHLEDRLPGYLGARSMLLVLDNFEQVCDAAPLIADLLKHTTNVSALATSRSPLRVSSEHEYAVPPLDVPDPERPADVRALAAHDSVALFVERARGVRADFQLTEDNAAAVAEICARLDGLPLAIELAAARVRSLSPQAIAARLDHRLALLSGGARDLPERQQTLSGAIDWSHDLLDEDDQRVFARFAVFAGGAGLPAIEDVVVDADQEGAALDAMDSLLDKSLVRLEPESEGEPRFAMLETIREYALQKLADRGEADLVRERHAAWVVAFVERETAGVLGPQRGPVLDRFEREHDNIRSALEWSLGSGRDEHAMRIFAGTWRFWQTRGFLGEARRHAERVMALRARDHPEARAAAAEAAGGIAYWQGDMEASRQWYAEAVELARASGDPSRIANALYNFSFPLGRTSVEIEEAIAVDKEALEIYQGLGDSAGVGKVLWGMGSSLYTDGDLERGQPYAEQALAVFEGTGDIFMTAWARYMVAVYTLTVDSALTRRNLREAHRLFVETNDASGHTLVFDALATLAWREGDVRTAMRLAGYAGNIEQRSGTGLARINRERAGFFPAELAADPELAEAFEEGGRLSLEEVTRLALGDEAGQAPSP